MILGESDRMEQLSDVSKCEYLEAASVKVADFEIKLYVFIFRCEAPYYVVSAAKVFTE
jgi:hypothetical protein